MSVILYTYWREFLILSLIMFIYLANSVYVDRIKLERDLAQSRYETVNVVLETQSRQILENSEATKRIVREEMLELDRRLEQLNRDQQQQIRDLLEVEIPQDSVEDLMDFLIDLASERLKWSDD